MDIRALVEQEVTAKTVDDFRRLIGQLSSSTPLLSEAELRRLIAAEATTVLVAIDGGQIVGTLTLAMFAIPTGIRAWIEDVVVDRDARGRGVGKALTQHALDHARAHGARTVDLTSRPSREAANAMYIKLGFVQRSTNVYRYDLAGDD